MALGGPEAVRSRSWRESSDWGIDGLGCIRRPLQTAVEAPWRPGIIEDCTLRRTAAKPVRLQLADAEAIRFLPDEIRSLRRITRATGGDTASVDNQLKICFDAAWVNVVRKQITRDKSMFLGKLQVEFSVSFEGKVVRRLHYVMPNLERTVRLASTAQFPSRCCFQCGGAPIP